MSEYIVMSFVIFIGTILGRAFYDFFYEKKRLPLSVPKPIYVTTCTSFINLDLIVNVRLKDKSLEFLSVSGNILTIDLPNAEEAFKDLKKRMGMNG